MKPACFSAGLTFHVPKYTQNKKLFWQKLNVRVVNLVAEFLCREYVAQDLHAMKLHNIHEKKYIHQSGIAEKKFQKKKILIIMFKILPHNV